MKVLVYISEDILHFGEEIIFSCLNSTFRSKQNDIHCACFVGYRRCIVRKYLLHVFCVLLLFVPYLILRWYPQYKAYFGHKKCSLNMADIVLIKVKSH